MSAESAAAYMAMSQAQRSANDRARLGDMRRVVGDHLAQAMLSGDRSRQQMAWAIAADLETVDCEVEYPIRNALKAVGAEYDRVWVAPEGRVTAAPNLKSLRFHLARHIAGAHVSGNDHQHARARELAKALDEVGLNVDDQVDRLVLEAVRSTSPSDRGTGGRADTCPF